MASPHLWAFFAPGDPPPPFVPQPEDVAVRDRILLLAKYAMQNGTSFIDMVSTKQVGNPEYAFLTPGGSDSGFFRWALFATGCGLPVEAPLPAGFVPPPPPMQQQQQPPVPSPAPAPAAPMHHQAAAHQPGFAPAPFQPAIASPYAPPAAAAGLPPGGYAAPAAPVPYVPPPGSKPQPPPIPPEVAAGFAQVLDNLTGSKDSIKASQGWFMQCAQHAPGLAYMMAARAAEGCFFEKLLHLIYLANDILFKAAGQKAEPGAQPAAPPDPAAAPAAIAAAFAPALGVMLAAANKAAVAADNTAGVDKLNKVLSFWGDKAVYEQQTIGRLRQEMLAAEPATALLANYPPAPPSSWGPPPGAPGFPTPAPAAGWGPPPAAGWGPPPGTAQPWASWQPHHAAAPPPPPAAAAGPWAAPPPPFGYPGAGPPPGFPPHLPPPGFPGALPPQQAPPSEPAGPEPTSSFSFPPGLIPQLARDKSKYSEPYAPIELAEIDKAGLPPPPEKDAYLKSRLDKFLAELRDYKPGTCRADLEEARAAAREQQGLEPDSDEELALGSTGSRLARRRALGQGAAAGARRRRAWVHEPPVADDGSYMGPGGGRGERLGLGAHAAANQDAAAQLGDVYSSYRRMRSTSYHIMIATGGGFNNPTVVPAPAQ